MAAGAVSASAITGRTALFRKQLGNHASKGVGNHANKGVVCHEFACRGHHYRSPRVTIHGTPISTEPSVKVKSQ